MTSEDWFLLFSLVVAMSTFLSILAFGRLSMGRIERKMKMDGLPRPCPWDGPGARIIWYAYAIGLPVGRFNSERDPFIDVPLVRRYARPTDKVLAVALLVSGNGLLLAILIGILAFGL
jgi:hypothetical protein